jgi:hypothetical protein
VEEEHESDSVVYAYRDNTFVDTDANDDPFSRNSVERFLPRHVSLRIVAQAGIFTTQPDIRSDLRLDRRVVRIIIPAQFRRPLKSMLYKYGIHRATLFPGLDGLAKHIEWLRTNVF